MPKRRNKGEGSFRYIEDKKLYRSDITIGTDPLTGKQKRKTIYAKTKQELIEKRNEFIKTNGLVDKNNITFEQNFYKYLYLIKKPKLKPKSWERYEGLYKNYICNAPFFYKKITDIKSTDIQIWYNTSNIGKSSLEVINRLIKSSLEMALEDNLVTKNVLKNVSMKYKSQVEKYNVLSVEEQKIFVEYLNSCTQKEEPLKYIFLFALTTGIRLGELIALQKTDIENNMVTINKSIHRIKKDGKYIQEITSPKTRTSTRQVPIPQKIIDMLDSMPKNNSTLLFPDEKTGSFIFTNRPLKRIKSLCKKLGITEITFHGLRHTYATRLFELNVQIKTVQKLMGHTDIQTTMNIYTHVMPNVIDEAINNFNDIL